MKKSKSTSHRREVLMELAGVANTLMSHQRDEVKIGAKLLRKNHFRLKRQQDKARKEE